MSNVLMPGLFGVQTPLNESQSHWLSLMNVSPLRSLDPPPCTQTKRPSLFCMRVKLWNATLQGPVGNHILLSFLPPFFVLFPFLFLPPCSRGTGERNGSCPQYLLGTHALIDDRLVIGWATRSWISLVAPSVLKMLAGTRRTQRERGVATPILNSESQTGRIGGGVWTNSWPHPHIPYMVSLTPHLLESDKNQTSGVIPNNRLKTPGKQTAVRSQCDHSSDANAAALHHLYTRITVIYSIGSESLWLYLGMWSCLCRCLQPTFKSLYI